MPSDTDQLREIGRVPGPDPARRIDVALGRRVMVLGDLLLPPTPSPSSLATSRDIAQKLAEWEGPGIVVVCGQLVIRAARGRPARPRPCALHQDLTAAFSAFVARPDSEVVMVVDPAQEADDLTAELEGLGVSIAPGADLHCVTGAGKRTVLIRTGTPRPDSNPPTDATPGDDRPWLAGMERLDDPRLARRFVTSRLLYRRLRRYLWAPPLVLAALALLLRLEFVVDGLGHVFRSPRQQRALQHAYDAVVVLAGAGHHHHRRGAVGRAWPSSSPSPPAASGGLSAARACRHRGRRAGWATAGARPTAHSLLILNGEDVLDVTRKAIADGAAGMIVGGALVPELTHLDAGFFASPGATSEVVHEHRGRFGLPPTFLHHRQEALVELETGRTCTSASCRPRSTCRWPPWANGCSPTTPWSRGGPPPPTLHPELVASWPGGASWPPAPEVAADRVRVRRIRRIAATALFVAGLIDLLSAVTTPVHHHIRLISQYVPIEVTQAAGALVAISGIGMIMLARGVLKGQRRSWLVAVGLLVASLVLHILHAADVVTLLVCAGVLTLLIVQRERFRAQAEQGTVRSAFLTLAVGGITANRRRHAGGGVRRTGPPSQPARLAPGAPRVGRTAHRH